MEGVAASRSRPLGGVYSTSRLFYRVSRQSSTLKHPNIRIKQQTPKGERGNSENDPERSLGKGLQHKLPRLLQQNLCRPKENWRSQACHRPQNVKQVPEAKTIQDGNCTVSKKSNEKRHVGLFHRSKGRLLPHSHPSSVKEVPQNLPRSGGVPVQSPSFRNLFSSMALHKDIQADSCHSKGKKYIHPSVSRRLAKQTVVIPGVSQRQAHNTPNMRTNRLHCQLGQIRTGTNTKVCVRGGSVRPSGRPGQTSRGEVVQTSSQSRAVSSTNINTSADLGKSAGSSKSIRRVCSVGQDPYSTHTVQSAPLLQSSEAPSSSPSTCMESDQSSTPVVDAEGEFFQRSANSSSSLPVQNLYGRFHGRLGSTFKPVKDLWVMVPVRKVIPYQQTRDESSQTGTARLQPTRERSDSGQFRQSDHSSLHQQAGRYQISKSDERDISTVRATPGKKLVTKSQLPARGQECHSRRIVQERPGHPIRVVTSPSDSQENLPSLAYSNDRSVRHKEKCKTSHICVSSTRSRSVGRGRPVLELERSDSLCLPSTSNHDQGPREDSAGRVSSDSDSLSMADPGMVHSPSGPINRPSTKDPSDTQGTQTDRQTNVPHKPRSSQTACLEAARGNLKGQGFSDEVTTRILGPQRQSTRKLYGSRWEIFCAWCQSHQKDPLKASVPLIAEFLNYLFTEKNFKPGTIEGYKTAIADFLKFHSKEDLNKNEVLIKLIRSFKSECPRTISRVPKWDLSLILSFLCKDPFEPMADADIRNATWKTVFLVTLAMAARASEVHALSFAELAFDEHYRFATVQPVPEFISKTNQQPYIKIPALGPNARGSREDRYLCPVRALKVYRAKSAELRKLNPQSRKLFISIRKDFNRDIKKNTLSGWIRALIQFSYQKCPQHVIQLSAAKPHEVRALATSVAWKINHCLPDILRAASWAHHNTFTSYYLKDISVMKGELHALGPFVAAQSVIQC